MKLLHRLSLFVIVVLVAVPLVIMAQDNGQPSNPNNDDLFIPLPTNANNDDDLVVPLVPTSDDSDLVVPLVPTNDDSDLVVPLVPSATPKPRPTNQPTTAITNGLWVLDPN